MSDNYSLFYAEDFASDSSFRKWILENDQQQAEFWNKWIQENPSKRPEVLQAVILLKTFSAEAPELSHTEMSKVIGNMVEKIAETAVRPNRWFYPQWLRYAAAVALLLVTVWYFYQPGRQPFHHAGTSIESAGWVVLERDENEAETVSLSDGTQITLEPQSRAKFLDPQKGERTLILEGSAFFQVARIPDRPFKVITNDVITTVLGTSFKVISDPTAGTTRVQVLTGKVEVAPRVGTNRKNAAILAANQEITYSSREETLTKRLVETPVAVKEQERTEFRYEDENVATILRDLELRYGVKINYNMEALEDCQITASFGNENFWETLNLICRPIRATVQQRDGEIYILSQGCRF